MPQSPVATAEEEGQYYLVRIPATAAGKQPRDIEFAPKKGATIPDDYSALQIDIERTLTVLNVLFPDTSAGFLGRRRGEKRFQEYYGKLGTLALAALGQDQVRIGRLALSGLQNEVVAREAGWVKNAYIRRLGFYAFLFFVPVVAFYFFCRYADPSTLFFRYREFFSMIAGGLLGTWLSFSIRRVELTFWDLSRLEEDRLDPGIRLLFVAGLVTVVGLLLANKVLAVTMGSFTTDFLNSGLRAVLIGVLCGLGEQGLSTAVARRASEFITGLGGSSGGKGPGGNTETGGGGQREGGAGGQIEEAKTQVKAIAPPAPESKVEPPQQNVQTGESPPTEPAEPRT